MSIFEQNRAIGITWDKENCRVVRLSASEVGYRLLSVWSGALSAGQSIAELIADGVRAVGMEDGDFVVSGGDGQGWETADAVMPRLSTEELRAALIFELKKKTPLPIEKLHWGYRIMNKKSPKTEPWHLRLMFVKSEHWERWMKTLAGLKMVDAVVPTEFCLDPLMAGKTAYLPDGRGGWLAYAPGESGRQMLEFNGEIALEDALPNDTFDTAVLKDRNDSLEFVAPVILASYALQSGFSADMSTVAELPAYLKANRNVALKICGGVLGAYILLAILYCMIVTFQAKVAQIRRINTEIKSVREEVKLYSTVNKNEEKLQQLMSELSGSKDNIPEFPLVLLELTKIIDDNHWMSQSMDWKNGQISFQVQSQFKDMELASRLEESAYIGDVTERSSSFNQNTSIYIQRFDMNARFDDDADAARRESSSKNENGALGADMVEGENGEGVEE